jgi:hypothetical protein
MATLHNAMGVKRVISPDTVTIFWPAVPFIVLVLAVLGAIGVTKLSALSVSAGHMGLHAPKI